MSNTIVPSNLLAKKAMESRPRSKATTKARYRRRSRVSPTSRGDDGTMEEQQGEGVAGLGWPRSWELTMER